MINTTITIQCYQNSNQKIKYSLIRSKRRKTSEIIVDENEITLRVPYDKTIAEAQKLIGSKINWIIEKQNQYQQRKIVIIKPTFSQGSTLPFLGENYEIEIKKSDNSDLEFNNNKFIISLNQIHDDERKIKSMYEDWLKTQASKTFEEKIRHFANVIKVEPKKVTVKRLKNRWGSATNKKTINLNVNLIKAPEDIIDYVIIHELCHLIIKKHSHHFWNLLNRYVDDCEKKIQWLEANGKHLI